MKDLITIAWRNIWRNTVRSGIVIAAVGIGVWALIFLLGFTTGMVNNYISSAIVHKTSHLQIHQPEWLDDPLVKNNITSDKGVIKFLKNTDSISAYSDRLIVNGTAASARSTRGVKIYGVDFKNENKTTQLLREIVEIKEGFNIDSISDNSIILGRDLVDELQLKIGSKIIINFSGKGGDIKSEALRIAAVYETGTTEIDERRVYLNKSSLAASMGIGMKKSHEIAVLLDEREFVSEIKNKLKERFPDLSIRDYKEISPSLALMGQQIYVSMAFMIAIVLLALVFGIINTMLMVVLERTKELGMLMAIGMNKASVYLMIVLETIFLSLLGAPLGMLLGWAFIKYFARYGVDLAVVAEGMEKYGMSSVLYPELDTTTYFIVGGSLILMAILSALYPAYRAIKLKPVEALRKI